MRIQGAEIVESVMPKEDPNWRFALGGTAASEGFVLRLTADDGTDGYGFCASAFHYGISVGGLRNALESFIPHLIDRDPFDVELARSGVTLAVGSGETILREARDYGWPSVAGLAIRERRTALNAGSARQRSRPTLARLRMAERRASRAA